MPVILIQSMCRQLPNYTSIDILHKTQHGIYNIQFVNGHAKLHTCGQKIARWRTPKLHGQLRDPKGIDVRVS